MIANTLKIDRRSFLVGTAAVGGGLALGLNLPFGGSVVRAQDGSPEINAWVVIRPDDTVVIRIARSEMGQGTLTGLAQMVAEELECDWSKVTTEYPTPGQSVARKRVWGNFSTGGSRGIRESNEYVRKGGATARVMLVQAAANAWGVPASECSAANSVVTHKPSGPDDHVRQGRGSRRQADPAGRRAAQGPEGLEDHRQVGEAPRHDRQGDRRAGVRGRSETARDAQRRDQGLPGVRRQGEELRGRQGHRHAWRPARGAGRRFRGGRRGRHVVAGQDRARRAAHRLGRGPERPGVERHHRRDAEGRPRCRSGLRAQPERRREGGHRRRGEEGRGGVRLSLPEPRADGADERHGEVHAGSLRGLGPDAERRGRVRGHDGRLRSPRREVRGLQDQSRRRIRAARGVPRLRDPGRPDRQADAGHAGEAPVDARGGHDARPVSPGHAVKADRSARRERKSDRVASPPVGTVDHRRRVPAKSPGRPGQSGLPGARSERRFRPRVHRAQSPDRPRDAQHARPAGVLARREHQPERHLHGMLHGRAGPGRRPGSARVPAQADGQAPQASRRAECRGRPGGMGQAGAAGRVSRAWPR